MANKADKPIKKDVFIIANGSFKNRRFYKKRLNGHKEKIIIGVDGGNNFLSQIGIKPHYAIGDFDSIEATLLQKYKQDPTVKVIYKNNQDITDLELAITIAQNLKPQNIVIFGATGDRLDHTINNINLLKKIKDDINARIIDEHHETQLVRSKTEIIGNIGDIVSIIPLTKATGINYTGLKWPARNLNVEADWATGISNVMTDKKASISLETGTLLIIKYI